MNRTTRCQVKDISKGLTDLQAPDYVGDTVIASGSTAAQLGATRVGAIAT